MKSLRTLLKTVRLVAIGAFLLAATGWARADELATALEPHVGQTLDLVELGTGKRLVRPMLEGITTRGERTTALRLRAEGETKTITVSVGGIAKIIAGRETIHEADAKASTTALARSRRARELHERQEAESRERMQTHGVEPWPPLSAEEHAAHVTELEAFVAEVRKEFPALAVSQTHEFLVATDIPAAQMAPFTAKLDAMHDFLCDLYGIPRGEPVWKGKCLVIAFLREEDFVAFEPRFMKVETGGAHGLCHQRSDGRVVMACHRGNDASAFAHMLVHETSHGFNHRWMSPEHLPNWLNEGIAEWVGTQVVPHCRQVPMKEARAAEFMKAGGGVGENFFATGPDHHINAVQYGIASSLVKFMVARDRKKFAAFVRGIKEGMSVDESLKASFDASLADVVAAYGKAVGVPGLKE
jgi:antitoxin (DNA-binding transcriptional repressor) of toxin-antitoxin stability system